MSRSGYYAYVKRKPSKTKQRREETKKEVKEVFEQSNEIYGSPKITAVLNHQGIKASQKYVYSIMRESGLKPRYIKHRTKTTVTKGFDQKLHNVLKRDFDPACPDSVWCTDITYVWTEEGFVYLTSIMDLFSRKIIAWTLSKSLSTDEVVRCVEMAKWRRKIKDPLVLHSDRGVQYTSQAYQGEAQGMTLSYSRKGNPWDNACIESFHSLIKREWLQFYRLKNYEEARAAIFEYIEGFYNTNRIHSWCGYMSPNEYEKAYRQSEKEMH